MWCRGQPLTVKQVEEIIKDRVVKNVIEVVAVEGPNGARIES